MINHKVCSYFIQKKFYHDLLHGRSDVKPFESIPGPLQLPIVGNWLLYKLKIYDIERYQEALRKMYEKYGPIVKEKVGFREPLLHIFEPEDAELYYRQEGKVPYILPLLNAVKKHRDENDIARSLGNTNGDEWYRLKNGVKNTMMFTPSIDRFMEPIGDVTDDLMHVILNKRTENGDLENINEVIDKWILEVAGLICLEKRLGCLNEHIDPILKSLIEANEDVLRLENEFKYSLSFYKYIRSSKYKRLTTQDDVIISTCEKFIEDAIENMKRSSHNKYKFLRSLLSNEKLTHKEIITIAVSFLIDGLSTVSPTLVFCLYCLAKNPKSQEILYKETSSVSNNNSKITVDVLSKMPYLKSVLKESMRMYPNGTEISRVNQKPLVLSGYYIPPKTHLSINLGVTLKSEKYFTDANTFKPERWIKNDSESSKIHPYIMSPFGTGARTCIGRKFSEQYLNVAVCKIINKFYLSYPIDGPEVQSVCHTLIKPKLSKAIKFTVRS